MYTKCNRLIGLESFVKSVTRFDGTGISNVYNGDGRLTQISCPDATLAFSYYANGLLKTAGDSQGIITNEFNTLNRLTKTCGLGPNGVVSYGYYPAGQVSAVTSIAGIVSCTLDAGDRLSSISSPADTFNYSYNTNNGLIAGVSCATVGLSVTHAFDSLDRVTDITWKNSSSNVVCGFAYGYSIAGMITQKVTTLNGQLSTNIYTYDSLDRLISETVTSAGLEPVERVVNYSYDLVGNRTQAVVNGTTAGYTLGIGNRLVSWGTSGENTISYNTAGCVTQIYVSGDSTKVLAWNSRYQVTEVRTNGIVAETYQYDALGRRISISDGSTTNYLVYDGIHAIAETDASETLLKSYTYGPGIDNILSMTVHGGTTSTYYYVKDHLGSVQAIVDSTGSIVESYQYDAWGNTTVFNGAGNQITQSAIGNRFAWQGREISWATRLYYFRARWYEPVTGRWLSNDPIGISGGLNQYVFVDNNPVNCSDPLGLAVFFIHGTWSSSAEAFPNDLRQHVMDFFNDQNMRVFEWSGDNCDKQRREAGSRLSVQLRLYRRNHPNEPIRVVAHSHGGNVALIASQVEGVMIDTLVTLGTPILNAYQAGQGIGVWNNVYSTSDRVQRLPSGAVRTSDQANNIQLQNFGHSALHTIAAWDAAFPPDR